MFKKIKKDKATLSRVAKIKKEFMPFYWAIEMERLHYSEREVGGEIEKGKLWFLNPRNCHANSVDNRSFEEERENREKGILSFHTHHDDAISDPSEADLIAAAGAGSELLINKEGVTLILAVEKLSLEKVGEMAVEIQNERYWIGPLSKEEIKEELGVQTFVLLKISPAKKLFYLLLKVVGQRIAKFFCSKAKQLP
jgi:hypothetical protein